MILEETKIGDLFRWASPDLEKPRDLTPAEKIQLERHEWRLAEQAETRELRCWRCTRTARTWVRQVCFDFKGNKAMPVQHAQISSADYPGPVPGFCLPCLIAGPRELAEAVYHDRPEIQFGARPTRWFVVMTDGSTIHGDCVELKPENLPRILVESS